MVVVVVVADCLCLNHWVKLKNRTQYIIVVSTGFVTVAINKEITGLSSATESTRAC